MTKKLSNPPIYYAIVQAQFSPVAAMATYINEIQDKLRFDGYTLFNEQKITQLHFDTSLPSGETKPKVIDLPIWRMTKPDRQSGFILSQNHLDFHTTHYETPDQFFKTFLTGLEKVHAIIKLDHLSRLGLRYLNAVLPLEKDNVEQYLNRELHGVRIEAPLRYLLNESVFDTQVENFPGTLVNRILIRSGPLGFPPDIPQHDLLPMSKFSKEDSILHAIIDIDHFIQELQKQSSLNFEQTRIQLSSLHREIKIILESNITDYARKTWG